MEFMLNTDTCIYIIECKPPRVIERFKQIKISRIGIPSITLSKLMDSVSKSSNPGQNQVALAQLVAPLEILPYGDEAAQYYGELRALLKKRGTPIGSFDTLIAAHALSIACTLVTNIEKEFIRVPKLIIENWVH